MAFAQDTAVGFAKNKVGFVISPEKEIALKYAIEGIAANISPEIRKKLDAKLEKSEEIGYFFDKEGYFKVYLKQKEQRGELLMHYALVSVWRISGELMSKDVRALKFWIAMPVTDSKLRMLEFEDGSVW